MADTVTKSCMSIYRKLEKSRVLNIVKDLQIPDILEFCYLYNLLWKYVKKRYINPGIDFFVCNYGWKPTCTRRKTLLWSKWIIFLRNACIRYTAMRVLCAIEAEKIDSIFDNRKVSLVSLMHHSYPALSWFDEFESGFIDIIYENESLFFLSTGS
jgi:hypothetical protein